MSVRAIALRGVMANIFHRVTFRNGEQDFFEFPFSSLTPHIRKQYDEFAKTMETSQLVLAWYGKAGPKDIKVCTNCSLDCLAVHDYCPRCGTKHDG
jgi:hypothetical protein